MKPGEYRHPKHAQAAALLRTGMTVKAVAAAVGMGRGAVLRVRRLEGIERQVHEQSRVVLLDNSTVQVDGTDHSVWSGRRDHGIPVVRYRGRAMSAMALAYEMWYGRPPVGSVKSDCHLDGGPEHCMNPAHIRDENDRQRERRQLRALMGLSESLGVCLNGHDQEVHGRVEASLRVYCGTCATERRAANRRISGK